MSGTTYSSNTDQIQELKFDFLLAVPPVHSCLYRVIKMLGYNNLTSFNKVNCCLQNHVGQKLNKIQDLYCNATVTDEILHDDDTVLHSRPISKISYLTQ